MIYDIRKLNRWQAFGLHLLASFIIFIALYLIITKIWYPGVFIHMGGWQGIKLIAGVDLVLGPLLTLIIFNPLKKSLKLDLSIIWFLQVACLSAGLWALESQRPLVQVLIDDSLKIITKSEFKEANKSINFLNKLKGPFPKYVMLDLPSDHTKIAISLVSGEVTGNPLPMKSELYIDIRTITTPNEQSRYQWLTDRLTPDEKNNCYWLPALAIHYTGETCINAAGALTIKTDK
ncbi:MAG: hypothetical protein K6L75_06850 [Cellvibrionaceae bacterium]